MLVVVVVEDNGRGQAWAEEVTKYKHEFFPHTQHPMSSKSVSSVAFTISSSARGKRICLGEPLCEILATRRQNNKAVKADRRDVVLARHQGY